MTDPDLPQSAVIEGGALTSTPPPTEVMSREVEDTGIVITDENLLERNTYDQLKDKNTFQVSAETALGQAITALYEKAKENIYIEHGCSVFTELVTDWRNSQPRKLEISEAVSGQSNEVDVVKNKPTDFNEVILHCHPADSESNFFSPQDIYNVITESTPISILMLQNTEGETATIALINPLYNNFDRELRQDTKDALLEIRNNRDQEVMNAINQVIGLSSEVDEEARMSTVSKTADEIFAISQKYEEKMFDYLVKNGFLFFISHDNTNFEKIETISTK